MALAPWGHRIIRMKWMNIHKRLGNSSWRLMKGFVSADIHGVCRLIGKDSDAGRDWRQEQKGVTEDEMVGWHHRSDGHEFEQAHKDSGGQGILRCCSSWDRRELDTTERLNNKGGGGMWGCGWLHKSFTEGKGFISEASSKCKEGNSGFC